MNVLKIGKRYIQNKNEQQLTMAISNAWQLLAAETVMNS